jgi:hypothetical protein
MRQKTKKKKKNPIEKKNPDKTQLREKKERTNRWVPPAFAEPPGWLV